VVLGLQYLHSKTGAIPEQHGEGRIPDATIAAVIRPPRLKTDRSVDALPGRQAATHPTPERKTSAPYAAFAFTALSHQPDEIVAEVAAR